MKKKTVKALKIILPLLLGVFFVLYSVLSATPEERETLWNNIIEANPFWMLVSLICGLLSHLSRAYRWRYLLEPLGYSVKFKNSFMAVMAGYLANLGIPRSGEILRAATVSSYDDVPFQKAFGTIISERIADLVMLILIVLSAMGLQYEQLDYFFEEYQINPLLSLPVILVIIAVGYFALRFIKNSTSNKFKKLKELITGVLEGIVSIFKMKKSLPFLLHTFFIWGMYLSMFFVIKYAIAGTEALSFSSVLVAFVVGSFAISITNGGIGVYPVAIGAVLIVFGIPKEDGEAFGWVVWGIQTLLNVAVGGLSLLFLPILNKTAQK